jgi:hypothetical protein
MNGLTAVFEIRKLRLRNYWADLVLPFPKKAQEMKAALLTCNSSYIQG